MKCQKVQKQIPAYLERVLDPQVHDAMTQHFNECSPCRQELAAYQEMLELVNQMEVEYPPPEVWDRFLDDLYVRIDQMESQRGRRVWRFQWRPVMLRVGVVLACVLIAALIFVQRDRGERLETPQVSFLKAVSSTLISEVEAHELSKLDEPPIEPEDPLSLKVEFPAPSSEASPELRVDLTALEETFEWPENPLLQMLAYQDLEFPVEGREP